MSEHIPDAAVEAVLVRRYGYAAPWPRRRASVREDLAAALPHLVTEEAVERAAWVFVRQRNGTIVIKHDMDDARKAIRAALGIQDEQEDER